MPESQMRQAALEWVCQCCYIALANGEPCDCPDDEAQHPAGLMGKLADTEVTPGMAYAEHEEDCLLHTMGGDAPGSYECECETQTFSRSPCDGCGTHLGGERHAVAAWFED